MQGLADQLTTRSALHGAEGRRAQFWTLKIDDRNERLLAHRS
jgi:hypothetical protein